MQKELTEITHDCIGYLWELLQDTRLRTNKRPGYSDPAETIGNHCLVQSNRTSWQTIFYVSIYTLKNGAQILVSYAFVKMSDYPG